MKGVVFTEFLCLVERRHGLPLLDEELQSAALSAGGRWTFEIREQEAVPCPTAT